MYIAIASMVMYKTLFFCSWMLSVSMVFIIFFSPIFFYTYFCSFLNAHEYKFRWRMEKKNTLYLCSRLLVAFSWMQIIKWQSRTIWNVDDTLTCFDQKLVKEKYHVVVIFEFSFVAYEILFAWLSFFSYRSFLFSSNVFSYGEQKQYKMNEWDEEKVVRYEDQLKKKKREKSTWHACMKHVKISSHS